MSEGNGTPAPETLDLIRRELKGLKIDKGKVKLREWDDLEDKTGREVSPWVGSDHPPIWFMRGVLWLWLRRKHPQLTFEDFGELDLEDLNATRGDDEKALDPTSAPPAPRGGKRKPTPSPTSAASGG